MKEWWERLGQRDRRAILFLVTALPLAAVYWLLLSPLRDAEQSALARVSASAALVGRLEALADEANALRQSVHPVAPADPGEPLLSAVEASGRDFLPRNAVERISPTAAGAVQVALAAVPFDRLAAWLGHLASARSLTVEQLTVSATEQPGVVRADVVLRRP